MTLRTVAGMITACSLVIGTTAPRASGCGYGLTPQDAVSEDPAVAGGAIAWFRSLGQAGMNELLATHAGTIEEQRAWLLGEGPAPDPALWARLSRALDQVGAQRDNWAAGLFWHTDLEQAKQVAAATGRPILSLRLLGRLDEDRSCANSRFFRTALYANQEISRALRERFVLHWETVRPVPLITIDFGDGRRMERTITGNSLHLMLDEQGRPIDALPGLYGPGAFLRWLDEASRLDAAIRGAGEPARAGLLGRHHGRYAAATIAPAITRAAGGEGLAAIPATWIAPTKMRVELPVLDAMGPGALVIEQPGLEALAPADLVDARLDRGSLALMAAKLGKPGAPDQGIVESFERSLADDTSRNQRDLHRQVHGWFAAGEVAGAAALTARIYQELFLMPESDPWLGLAPSRAYAALDGGGLLEP